jgi:hypothetical protein
VPLFYRRRKLIESLTQSIRLLMPADPGLERMLDAVRQYNPAAKRTIGGGVCVDGKHFYLGPPVEIDAELPREADLPPGITAARFVNWVLARSPGESKADLRDRDKTYRAQARCLLGGLAARFNGTAVPEPDPGTLRVDVFTPRQIDTAGLSSLVSSCVPELARASIGPLDDGQVVSLIAAPELKEKLEGGSAFGVLSVWDDEARFGVELWPAKIALHPILEDWTGGRSLAVLAGLGKVKLTDLSMIVVRTEQPWRGAEPALVRAVGRAALHLASDTGGVAVDPFGFGIHDPSELVLH